MTTSNKKNNRNDSPGRTMLDLPAAAAHLGLSTSYVQKMALAGILPSYVIFNPLEKSRRPTRRYAAADLDAWLDQHYVPASTSSAPPAGTPARTRRAPQHQGARPVVAGRGRVSARAALAEQRAAGTGEQ